MRHPIFALAALLALAGIPAEGAAQPARRCFPEAAPVITDCIEGRLASFWQANGGLPVFGYPLGPQRDELVENRSLQAQPFERNRLELHPENPPPYDVLLGRLGVEALARQGRDWTNFPKADPAAPHFFAATGQAIAPEFWPFWSSQGLELGDHAGKSFAESPALFGMPISPLQSETIEGRQYQVQWFERARLELHPENPPGSRVLLGLLQRDLVAEALPPGGFVVAQGAQLTRLGRPVTLKGVNYYPQWRPWGEMWREWDAPQTERELRRARSDLGINTVRVLLPYNYSGSKTGAGQVTPKLLGRMAELAQIAGSLDIRLLVTLFDFQHDFPAPGSPAEQQNIAYLQALIGPFADDERVLGWDLHNEPDYYAAWRDEGPEVVVGWLARMADVVHALAPQQLVTVGMGHHRNLWVPGPDGRRAIDFSDVVSMHSYSADTIARDMDELRAQTGKPILVEEFGWPTGPACVENYTEDTQLRLFQAVLGAARARGAGALAWSLRDFDARPTKRWDSREEYFGLYRADGSLKPAAAELRAFAAAPLPSATSSSLPLTSTNPGFPDDPQTAPVEIRGSGHTVKGVFRRAWDLFGGRASFGLPLTEAFERPDDGRVVQYFERAALEYFPDNAADPRSTPEPEQLMRVLVPVGLGAQYAAGRDLPPGERPADGPFAALYAQINGPWRLGRAISGVVIEPIGGVDVQVQYFERGRLELRPGEATAHVSELGAWAWGAQCTAR